jgi:hypothetical protein
MSRYPPEKLDEGAPVRPYETWTTHLGKKMSGHRCHGKSKRSQLQCDRRAALGQDVCKMHGGGSPQALEKGRERIAAETAHATAQRTLAQPDAVRDPLTALANIAGEVLALNEFLHAQVDELNGTITYWTDSSFSDAEGRRGHATSAQGWGASRDSCPVGSCDRASTGRTPRVELDNLDMRTGE